MPTDDERRAVAERLRSVAREVDRGGFSETIKHVKLAVFEDLDRYRPSGTLDRLADLIEPSCDRDALLKVADMLECDGECSECECGKGTFCEAPTIAAARIREALGVTDG